MGTVKAKISIQSNRALYHCLPKDKLRTNNWGQGRYHRLLMPYIVTVVLYLHSAHIKAAGTRCVHKAQVKGQWQWLVWCTWPGAASPNQCSRPVSEQTSANMSFLQYHQNTCVCCYTRRGSGHHSPQWQLLQMVNCPATKANCIKNVNCHNARMSGLCIVYKCWSCTTQLLVSRTTTEPTPSCSGIWT